MEILILILFSLFGVLFGRLDAFIGEIGWKIRHGLHIALRALIMGVAAFYLYKHQPYDLFIIPMGLALFGMVFRKMFNYFSMRGFDFVGTTAYYDRLGHWISKKIPILEPVHALYCIEFLGFIVPLFLHMKGII